MDDILEIRMWVRIGIFCLLVLAISVAGWISLGLHNVFGIPLSVLIFVLVFVGLPYYLNHLHEKKISMRKQEMREIEDRIFRKDLKDKYSHNE